MTARSHTRSHHRRKRLRALRQITYNSTHLDVLTPDQLAVRLVERGLAPFSVLGPGPHPHVTIPTTDRTDR